MPTDPALLWSTSKFFAIALVITFVGIFFLNGVLNMVLHLGVPSGALAAAPGIVIAMLLPRWRWFAQRRTR
jgi:hypothetical protein